MRGILGSMKVAWILALLLFAPTSAAQEGPRCLKCKQVGLVPCVEHKKKDCELEGNALYCSFMADCAVCGGTGWLDCERCEYPDAERRNAEKRLKVKELEPELKKLDEEMGRTLRKAESEHFVLIWEIDELKVDKRRLKDHELLHLYVDRLEELYDAYVNTFGVDDRDFKEKPRVFAWSFMPDHYRAGKRFCGGEGERGIKRLGSTPSFSFPVLKKYFKDDEVLHRHLLHNVAHLLLSHQNPPQWIGQMKGGWADAGVAHWFEDHFFEICDNYCYQEVDTSQGFKGGKWRPRVRKLVAMGKAAPAAEVMQKNTTILTQDDHALSFSYVDFLIQKDAQKTNRLLMRLRSKVPLRDSMKEVFGMNLIQFEKEWRDWVMATYPAR